MDYDLIIIGSGPAGYVSAIRAGQIGLKTAIVEKDNVGGMCLNWGCIPTKALLESAKKYETAKNVSSFGIDGIDVKKLSFNWKRAIKRSEKIVGRLTKGVEYLLKKNGIDIINGRAVINSENSVGVENRLLETKNIIIATGSRPSKLDFPIPDELILEIENLLKLDNLPSNPVVVGKDAHAVELAQFFNLLGIEVTLFVPGNDLIPEMDSFLSDYINKMFKKAKLRVLFDSEIKGYEDGELIINNDRIPCDLLINGSSRNAVKPESNIEFILDNGFLNVNEFLQTNINNVYAIGDVNGKNKFAHGASAQGLHAVNVIGGITKPFDFTKFPINIYTYPEIAQIGLCESEIKDKGIEYKISDYPLSANGKAIIEGQIEGQIRLLSEKKYGEVLGVQIIAENATDMISEASAFIQLEGTVYDVANTIHAHPTVSEIFMESGFVAFDQPIHK